MAVATRAGRRQRHRPSGDEAVEMGPGSVGERPARKTGAGIVELGSLDAGEPQHVAIGELRVAPSGAPVALSSRMPASASQAAEPGVPAASAASISIAPI